MRYDDIPKKARNGIEARILAIVKKYGHEQFRTVANRYINERREKEKLEREIAQREKELSKLRSKR